MTEEYENNKNSILENAGRRKAVKTIVGGVTAVAAYNLLPARWGVPVIESVFLPAHAQTSGEAGDELLASYTTPGSYSFTVPAGVTSIQVRMSGGGGGGGGATGGTGGTGGSGELIEETLTVTPGESLAIVVGAGGTGGGGYEPIPNSIEYGPGGYGGGGGQLSSVGATLISSGGGGGGGEGPGTATNGADGEGPNGGTGGTGGAPASSGGDAGAGGGAAGGAGATSASDYDTNGGNDGSDGADGFVYLSL